MASLKKKLKVFISYSRKDSDYLEEMLPQLQALVSEGLIEITGDISLRAGDKWEDVLSKYIYEADIIVFLVSSDSISSPFIGDEMAIAVQRSLKENIRVIPVLLRDCEWRKTPLADFFFIPKGARPMQFHSKLQREELFRELAAEIIRVAEGYGEIWESIVKKEYDERTGTLNLSNYNLPVIPSAIAEMHWLHTLNLTNNHITDISLVSKLPNLDSLYLSANQIQDISHISQLSKLNFLDLNNNAVNDISPLNKRSLKILYLHNNNIATIPDLSEMINLEELDLSGNKITEISGMKNLTRLGFLNISHNNLSGLKGIDNLTSLVDLRATNNKIEKIEGLQKLTKLNCLDLFKNEITKISGLDNNVNLTILGLSGNKIELLKNIDHLTLLETLYVAHNNIEDITELQALGNLKRVVLTNNRITDLFPLKSFIEKDIPVRAEYSFNPDEAGFFVKDNPVQYPPMEVLLQGRDAILRNFAQQERSQQEKLDAYQSNDIKLILIGNANVGKTHLAGYIKTNRTNVPPNNASTHGMVNDIVTYSSPAVPSPVKMRILDFGGQEYYHDTHHLFFTSDTIYLLLWEKESNRFGLKTEKRFSNSTHREEDETNAVFPVAYWLDAVNYFLSQKEKERKNTSSSKTSSLLLDTDPCVVLVETKRNKKGTFMLNTSSIEEYRHLVHSQVGVSIYRDNNGVLISTGADSLFDSINDLTGSMFEKKWSGYYKLVVDFFEGIDLPENKDLLTEPGATELIVTLQDCIVLFNAIIKKKGYKYRFDNANAIDLCRFLANRGYILYFENSRNTICLYPEKLTQEIYRVLNTKYNGVGLISAAEISSADPQVISIMQAFKLLIPHPGGSGFIAPQLLPENTSIHLSLFMDAFKPALLRFSITGYIHKNIIQELFYLFKEHLLKEDTQNYIWKNGFVIKLDNELYRINISSNPDSRIIEIQYLNTPNFKVLNKISELISSALGTRKFCKEVSTDGVFFVPLDVIRNNIKLSQCIYNNKLVRLADYKNFLDEGSREYAMKKLFISYSSKNTAFMKRFVTHLEPLKRKGDIDYWHDRMIEPGSKWDDAIKKEMEQSDIIIFLLSPDFIATNYIFDVEIPKALEQFSDEKSKLFFVELQACSWDETILKDYQQTTDAAGDNKALLTIAEPLNDAEWKKVIAKLKDKINPKQAAVT